MSERQAGLIAAFVIAVALILAGAKVTRDNDVWSKFIASCESRGGFAVSGIKAGSMGCVKELP